MAKPPILFIHGMWSTPEAFKLVRPPLEEAGHVVHAADYRPGAVARAGSLSHVGLADYVASLEAIVASMPEKPIIIGHSLGGLLAQLLAVRVKPPGLVTLSTAPSNGTTILPAWSATKSVWDATTRWGFWREVSTYSRKDAEYGVFNTAPRDEADAEIAALVPDSGRVLAQIAFAAFDSDKAATVDYAKLTCPALVVVGTEDRITPPVFSRSTARRIQGPVTYKEIHGMGHWILGRDGAPLVARHILDFVG